MAWWREGVLYEIYPRSFADSDGDGVGDLRGITSRLDYLQWLGVSGLWLNPTFPSPNVDWGYDVSDYYGVHPDLGTPEDLDHLIAEAARRGIRVLLDLVPNHTSNQHPWFRTRPDFYLWADGEPPNNWSSFFNGGSAWTPDEETGRRYLAQFSPRQPDLDWWNRDVRDEFDRILRFWFDRGVAGFRIDVAHALIKDRELRDNTLYAPGDPRWVERLGHWNDYSMKRPETHEIFERWHRVAQEYDPPGVLVGETYVTELEQLVGYYGDGTNELDLCFNFAFVHAPFEAEALRSIVDEYERLLPEAAWPVWTASNHDVGRLATHWAKGDPRKARAALTILLTLRGTPFLYMGDELGLPDGSVRRERRLDLATPSRDPGRTPLPWTLSGDEWRDPWLPLSDTRVNVEEQRGDPGSMLVYVRALIQRRRSFVNAPYESLSSRDGVWAYRRGPVTVAVNMTDEASEHDGRSLVPWEAVAVSA